MSRSWHFFTVDLEITNICAGHCAFCPREAITRPSGAMDDELFQTVAGKLLQRSAQITLSGMGDPLSHPRWESFIGYFREQGGKAGLQVGCASLDQGTIERLVAAGPAFINLSLPSLSHEPLRRLLPGRQPGELIALGKRLAERCRGRIPLTVIGMGTALDDPTTNKEFIDFWKREGVAARVFPCHGRGGHFTDREILGKNRPGLNRPCGLLARHGFITWQGQLLACCHDLSGETAMGSLAGEAFEGIAERKAAATKRRPPFALCRRCDEPLRDLPLPDDDPPATARQRARYFRQLGRWVGDS
jgi:hypothetical protein